MAIAAESARALVTRALGDGYRDAGTLDELAGRFRREGYVRLPRLLRVRGRLGHDAHGPVAAAVAAARADGALRVADHRSGDAYLLRADRCLHRVSPLTMPIAVEVALNFAYEQTADASYGDSATVLYGYEDPAHAR